MKTGCCFLLQGLSSFLAPFQQMLPMHSQGCVLLCIAAFIYIFPPLNAMKRGLSALHRGGVRGGSLQSPQGSRVNSGRITATCRGCSQSTGAFVALSRLGSSQWHRHSCWGLSPSGGTRHSLGQAPAAPGAGALQSTLCSWLLLKGQHNLSARERLSLDRE